MSKEKIVRTKQVSHTRNEQRMLCAVQVHHITVYTVHGASEHRSIDV